MHARLRIGIAAAAVALLVVACTSEAPRPRPSSPSSQPLSRQLAGQVAAVTFVTVGELTKWTVIRHWGPTSVARLRSLLDGLLVLPYDTQIAARWGELQAYAQLRGRPRPVNDTWIAVCCLVRELPLATFNMKDYLDFSEHEGLELLT